MKCSIPVRAPTLLFALATVLVAAVLCVDLAAVEPPPASWAWRPGPAVPPRGPFFGGQVLPSPIPFPNPNPFPFPLQPQFPFPKGLPPGAFEPGATGSTDRCLIIASEIDPGFLKTAAGGIDPGIFKEPRVQGLPIRSPGGWQGSLTPWEPNEGPTIHRRRR
jgi:hypothetical protein